MTPLNPVWELNNIKSDFEKTGKIVISGMSGTFPQAQNVKEFYKILSKKENPISSNMTRWNYDHPELSQYVGQITRIEHFDAQFFGIHYRLGTKMDTIAKKLLEHAYQAIYDAGLSPEHLNNKRVGVYVGACISETEKAMFYDYKAKTDFGIVGCSKTMFANRISYWLNIKGPSISVDGEGCSSIQALEMAYHDINRGVCDAAIVGGGNTCLHPQSVIQYSRSMNISKDGKSRSFDQNACGCAKSEAINVLFIQRREHALRIYAELIHVKCEFTSLDSEDNSELSFYRKPQVLIDFLNKFYTEANVSPNAVEYIDAFGSATPEVDIAELQAIDKVFCIKRHDPLLIGSVISNIGYSDASHGISSIIKVLLGYHKGQLLGNLHLETPRQDVEALQDGRISILTGNKDFRQTYTAINGLSLSGLNSHVLLRGSYKPKDYNRYKSNIPHIVTLSGRQESAVQNIFDELKSNPIDPEQLALLHHAHEKNIKGHMSRGYIILEKGDNQETVVVSERNNYFNETKRSLWFVYSGMGSQWTAMGEQLMRIPVFSAAIKRCQRALDPMGIDIVHIITSHDATIYDNILNSFVGIAAIQIGLTDVLQDLGIIPDHVIGHSVGELGCGYADGCLTAEEMILAACGRGQISLNTPFIQGSMAAIGLGYKRISKICPPDIEIACHNSAESCTISGPADSMRNFVAKLTSMNIFAKEVPCSNIAYHSKYIAHAGPLLLQYLKEVIKSPKPRSKRWVSTSVPQEKWDDPSAKLCSAEYHTNNLLSPVLFEETSQLIPKNAVLVEVAPHGLLQAILKRSFPKCINIAITKRKHPNNVVYLLEAIGRLYQEGFLPKVKELYQKIEFPVSTGTPMLSHLVEWSHTEKWPVTLYMSADRKTAAACNFVLSIHDDEHSFYKGNIIRGKILYPFAAALVAVWDTLAMFMKMPKQQMSVEFREVHLYSQPILHDNRQLHLNVSFHRGTGWFEVMDEITKVATGYVRTEISSIPKIVSEFTQSNYLDSNEIYSLFANRHYQYKDDFQSIFKTSVSLTEAELLWSNNWVTFIDSLIQLQSLKRQHSGVSQPCYIRNLTINIANHNTTKCTADGRPLMDAQILEEYDTTSCGGVTMNTIRFVDIPSSSEHAVTLTALKFVPFMESECMSNNNMDITSILKVYLQIVFENINKNTINMIEILDSVSAKSGAGEVNKVNNVLDIKIQYKTMYKSAILKDQMDLLKDVDLLIVNNLSSEEKICQNLSKVLHNDTFVMNREYDMKHRQPFSRYRVVCSHHLPGIKTELLRWGQCSLLPISNCITVRSQNDIELLSSVVSNLKNHQKLLVVTYREYWDQVKDLINLRRKSSHQPQIYLRMVNIKCVDNDYIANESLDLVFNMIEKDTYGGQYYVDIPEKNNHLTRQSTVMLRCKEAGCIDSLHWVHITEPKGTGIAVKVHYAGLNYLDSKRAFGEIMMDNKTEDLETFGMDYSGVTKKGTRVMGLVKGGAVSSWVMAQAQLLWPVPEYWTLEDAATVPLAYCLAFYCMVIKYKHISPGTRVFVHGGTGALGQAVISVALANGCEVFTTVSNMHKKLFLRRLFPNLPDDHIGNSRDSTFCDAILNATNGEGCDLLITCVKGTLKNATLRCCARNGQVIDLLQIQTRERFPYGMSHMAKIQSYIAIDISSILNNDNIEELTYLQQLVSDGIARGYVRPLSRITYEPQNVSRAFSLLNYCRHRGRVLLRMHDLVGIKGEQEIQCSPDKFQLILCDNEVFGTLLAERLVQRGARKLQIISAGKTNLLDFKTRFWKKLQVQVKTYAHAMEENNVTKIIKESNDLGLIEGIHVSITDLHDEIDDVVKITNVLNTLDVVSRTICPSLKYFGILSTDDNIGQQICFTRAKHYLPVTNMKISRSLYCENAENSNESSTISMMDIMNAYERSILSQEVVTKLQNNALSNPSLIQQIATAADITFKEDTNDEKTLFDMGLDTRKSQAVFAFLRNKYNITLTEEEISLLTVKRIQQLENILTDKKYEETTGLSTFISHVDPDELLASTVMTFLCTRATNSDMRHDEFDMTQTYLCIVPGMEGHYARFNVLCERLKIPALLLQPDQSRPHETIIETAQRYSQIILQTMKNRSQFYLLGYETGVLIALEMAAILERNGLMGTVSCIGGGPTDIKMLLEHYLRGYKSAEPEILKEIVMKHMITLIAGKHMNKVMEDALESNLPWNEKMEICIRILLGRAKYSAQYMRTRIKISIWQLQNALNYKPILKPLSSKIVLLKPHLGGNSRLESGTVSESLQMLSKRPVAVHYLRAPLAHATYDLRCASIINHYLSDTLLKDFESKNCCETYLLNPDAFISKVDF